jgi:magnesium chelatase subunit D
MPRESSQTVDSVVADLYRVALIAALTDCGVLLRSRADPLRDCWIALVEQVRAQLQKSGNSVFIPFHADEGALFGAIDFSGSLALAKRVHTTGLFSRAHGAVVLVGTAERLSTAQASKIIHGFEQLAQPHCLLIALDEGDFADSQEDGLQVPEVLQQRLGLTVDLHGLNMRHWQALRDCEVPSDFADAAALYASSTIDTASLQNLAVAGVQLGIQGMRACEQALQVMRACAALEGRTTVEIEDWEFALRWVLLPKATIVPAAQSAQDDAQPDELPSESEPPQSQDKDNADPEQRDPPDSTTIEQLSDMVLQAALARIPPNLLMLLSTQARAKKASGGSSGALHHNQHGRRGRVLKNARQLRPDLLATLQEAARWQKLRTVRPDSNCAIAVSKSDLRYRQRDQKAKTTMIFAVDASGSAAAARLAETKGAIELLLAQCYVRRDQVAMISFRGSQAQIILPATRSLTRAKRELSGLPGGGATPIAAAIDCAVIEAKRAIKRGETPYIIMLSDGRANISRSGDPGRTAAHNEALTSAKQLAVSAIATLFIDTTALSFASPTTKTKVPLALELAQAMQAQYMALPNADARRLAAVIEHAVTQ